ncbi:Bud site selection protein 6 [Haplosporangium gracile]|nr:Bud site selection protein 6 [Haplosporangium gracile]
MNPIEATVTKLLVATKQLLESLTLWSNRKVSEEHVSDIFVQLATQFNLASQAFHEVGIDTSELAHVPDDLRNCLETALGEDPSPASLDQYLPKIKEVIINLLQGLRLKQNLYRERHEAKAARTNTPPPQSPLAPPPTMPLPPTATPPTATPPTATPPTATTSGRTRTSLSSSRQPSISRPPEPVEAPTTQNDFNMSNQLPKPSTFVAPTPTFSVSAPQDEPSHAETLASLRKSDTIIRRASSRRHSQRFSTLLEQNTPPVPRRQHPIPDSNLSAAYPGYAYSQGSSPVTSPPLPLPHNQFSPMTSPPLGNLPTSPAFSTTSTNGYMDSMPLPPTIPMPGLPTASTPGSTAPPAPSDADDSTMTTAHIPNGSLESVGGVAAPSDATGIPESTETSAPTHSEQPAAEPAETSLTLFLQVGKSVKKTKFEGELTHSGLRMLFMEKFQYNPGQEDFPTIYVKDPQTNIHYELESLVDVKQNAFLSLNVDDLENIQRRMDQGFASLTKELHDIRKAQEALEMARHKQATAAAAAAAASALVAANTPERNNASAGSENPQALRSMVQKVMAKTKALPATTATPATPVQSKASVAELKAYQEEVQTLRRDLGVVRQLYSELQSETKMMLGNLAGYTSKIRKQALDAPVSSRMIIETGKVKLDKKSEDLTNKIEDLQDVVDDMKINVTQRRGRPSESSMTFVDKQCEQIDKDIAELSDYIQTIRPSWKKTWEVELQTIVKEQMFLKEQEALLEDLKEDRSSLLQTLGNLKKLTELQVKTGGSGSKEYVFQPVVDEDFEGLKTVMEEVKMIEPDSNKRLKAMAQMEKLRHIELSSRIDEFEEELTTFVGASKLRKTGGALEVERQRQQRDSENLKAMFAAKKTVEPLVPVDEEEAIPEEAPMVEAAAVPAAEAVVPAVEAVVPAVEAVVPAVEAVVPAVEAVVPAAAEAVVPAAEAVVPAAEVAVPDVTEDEVPTTEAEDPNDLL